MKAISLWQPWAHWIAEGIKTIETRTHDRFKGLVGQRIAIHAAKRYDGHALVFAEEYLSKDAYCKLAQAKVLMGAIICTAIVSEARWLNPVYAPAALIECRSPRFGIFLEGIEKLEIPIPCKGRQGIFEVNI